MKKYYKNISLNALIIFAVITVYSFFDGTCLRGCVSPDNLPGREWLTPFFNLINRFLYSLRTSIPILFLISLLDHWIKPKIRFFLLGIITLFSLMLINIFWSNPKGPDVGESFAIAGLAMFSFGILLPLTIINYFQSNFLNAFTANFIIFLITLESYLIILGTKSWKGLIPLVLAWGFYLISNNNNKQSKLEISVLIILSSFWIMFALILSGMT